MILDGGPVGIGIESTIIDLTEEQPMVLRPGYITPQMLSEVIGREVIIDPGILALDDTKRPKAPGMKYKHYAPKADMVIVEGDETSVITKIKELTAGQKAAGKRVAVIASDETKAQYVDARERVLCEKQQSAPEAGNMDNQESRTGSADVILSMGSRTDEDSIARHLYHILRECDELGVDVIYSESFSTPRIGNAIMNRLLKAAGHQVIQA
jgi:hypothetical protein